MFNLYGQTLSLFMAGPTSVLESTRFLQKKCTYQRPKSLGNNNRTKTPVGEKGLFICGQICLCKQLLPQINSCCQEEIGKLTKWHPHGPTIVWCLSKKVASRKTTTRQLCWLWIVSLCQTCPCTGWTTCRSMVGCWEMLPHFSASCSQCQ